MITSSPPMMICCIVIRWSASLLAAHEAHPHAIAAARTHLIMFNKDGSRTNMRIGFTKHRITIPRS